MNLFDMVRRKDRNITLAGKADHAKFPLQGESWRGVRLWKGSSVRIHGIRRFNDFRSFPSTIGWMVQTPNGTSLRVAFVDKAGKARSERIYSGSFQPIFFLWPRKPDSNIDLLLEVIGESSEPVLLGAHRVLSRKWLIACAQGKGVEIGPGPSPQILPKEGVEVSYVEQMPPQEWDRLYNAAGKYRVQPELWDNYVVGNAKDLPVADGALDFLFASHVFEHLANPIGHLANWRTKLAPRGKVICIVPELHGAKDGFQHPSTMAEWKAEYEHGIWEPTESHYRRYLSHSSDESRLKAQMDEKASIHVHFYDNRNCEMLLHHAVAKLGYRDFVIEHTPNHKDFHFVLHNC